jgi:hypothetical protein
MYTTLSKPNRLYCKGLFSSARITHRHGLTILSKQYPEVDRDENDILEVGCKAEEVLDDTCPACHSRISTEDKVCSSLTERKENIWSVDGIFGVKAESDRENNKCIQKEPIIMILEEKNEK